MPTSISLYNNKKVEHKLQLRLDITIYFAISCSHHKLFLFCFVGGCSARIKRCCIICTLKTKKFGHTQCIPLTNENIVQSIFSPQ